MPLLKKKRKNDLDDEAEGLNKAFQQAIKVAPKPPGHDIVPKRTATPLEVYARYKLLKKRVRTRLAERFIEGSEGQEKYIAGGVYAVAGKYKVRGELMDWDHELRSLDAKSDEKVRLQLITHLAKRLKVRT